ncbi:MAG: RNA-binding protein [Pseudomonadota bacterium]
MHSETRQTQSPQTSGDTIPGESVRRCALTRTQRAKSDLIRFVLGPDGTVVPDLKERLPGRGVWLTASSDMVTEAARRKVFGRGLKADARAPEGLAEQVDSLLAEAALGAFAMANKAGEVVFGHTKVEDALQKGRTIALVHATDAAADGCRKLDGKARAVTGGQGLSAICVFTADELGLASGRTNVIHAALIQGGAAQKFLAAASRVERYRKGISAFADRHGLDTEQE